MQLNAEQLKQFDEEGWVFLPEVFSQEEIDVLKRAGVLHAP